MILLNYLSPMFQCLVLDGLLQKQLNEQDIEGAVKDRGQRVGKVEIRVLAFGIWKDWDRARKRGKDKVEEETKAKKACIKGVAVCVAFPWESPDL